jgi:hypothetical protein
MNPSRFTVPSGWTLVAKQDFEGSITSPQSIQKGDVATSNPHTGSKSLHYAVLGEGITADWDLAQGATGSFSDLYMSFYLFLDTNARMNDELYWMHIRKGFPGGGFQEIVVDMTSNLAGNFNSTDFRPFIEPQFTQPGGSDLGTFGRYSQFNVPLPLGTWAQLETWYHPNSSSLNDGFLRLYLNGNLLFSCEGCNLNGTLDMSGAELEATGYYTKNIWRDPGGSCSSVLAGGTMSGTCPDMATCACYPGQHFNMWVDDIIVIKK